MAKERLDLLLVQRGLAPTRQKAQALIMSGQVLVNDTPVEKAGQAVSVEAAIRIRGALSRFVGRGGDKLEGAIRHFDLDLTEVVALDVGASTGGFTDCLLHYGCRKVYAVDVGYNQLDQKLRSDQRVVVMERLHAADLTASLFSPRPSFVTIDVSFIGLRKVLPHVLPVMDSRFRALVLVKPQFELGREFVGKGGVVKDEAHQLEAVRLVEEHARELGLACRGSTACVLRGEKKGNQEYFVLLESARYSESEAAASE